MNVKSSVRNIISEISSVMEEIDENTVEEVISEILKANKIFIVGAGRSGLVGKAFAMPVAFVFVRVAANVNDFIFARCKPSVPF